MKRRDLNPGDVFVYVGDPFFDAKEVGMIRYVHGDTPPWFEGAMPSPRVDIGGDFVDQIALDCEVVLIRKPTGRIEKRAEMRDAVSEAIEVLEQLRDSI